MLTAENIVSCSGDNIVTLTPEQRMDYLRRGFSRRSFARLAALAGAGGSSLPLFNEAALAPGLSRWEGPPDPVMINANENPLGPCKEAREAAHNMVAYGGRYRYGEADKRSEEHTSELQSRFGI